MASNTFHLYEDIELLNYLKEESLKEDHEEVYEIKPNYIYSFSKNSTLKFIPTETLIYSEKCQCGFFESIANILLLVRRILQFKSKIDREYIIKNGFKWIQAISYFLKTDEEAIIDSLMMVFDSFEVKLKYHFMCIQIPVISKNVEKITNYATLFKMILNIINKSPETILESNMMLISIDEREFLINSIRTNEAAYCDFYSIKDFPNIHKFKENPKSSQNEKYLLIIKKLCEEKNINLDDIFKEI